VRPRAALLCLILLALAGGAWISVRWRIRSGALAGSAKDLPRLRQDQPPHGGTPVSLGDGQFNLELVRDPATGTLQAYLLDGELEGYIRIRARELVLKVELEGRRRTLRLLPVADAATGETVGDTSLFQARADWLKGPAAIQGIIPEVAIRGRVFRSVSFRVPDGSGPG